MSKKVAQVEIRPSCIKLHGSEDAFDLAIKHIEANYKMWSPKEMNKTFRIELHID